MIWLNHLLLLSSLLLYAHCKSYYFRLFNDLEKYYNSLNQRRSRKINRNPILFHEVPALRASFPACMRRILDTLETGEKLKHYPRFYFSLFLKELGMDSSEAKKFWFHYYSKIRGGKYWTIFINKMSNFIFQNNWIQDFWILRPRIKRLGRKGFQIWLQY